MNSQKKKLETVFAKFKGIKMTKEMIKARVLDIYNMDEDELNEFGTKVSISDVDDKSKMFLYRAIEDRILQLREIRELQSSCVVMSEIKAGDLS